jgi:hypothetical protein
VRAHRFEKHSDVKHFQTIDEVGSQIDVVLVRGATRRRLSRSPISKRPLPISQTSSCMARSTARTVFIAQVRGFRLTPRDTLALDRGTTKAMNDRRASDAQEAKSSRVGRKMFSFSGSHPRPPRSKSIEASRRSNSGPTRPAPPNRRSLVVRAAAITCTFEPPGSVMVASAACGDSSS